MTTDKPQEKTLVVILGATATGKTDIGIRLAQAFRSEIISSDSRQIYREMSIGTAKPTAEELAAVPHHFIGTRSATEDYSAGRYEEEALQCIEELFRRHDILFLVGGSGLYIDALCNGMDALPQTDPDLRQQLTRELEQQGLEALTLRLRDLDPIYYEQVDRANPQRIIRALEVCLQTGKPYSSLRKQTVKQRPFRILKIGIRMPRTQLYERIDRRVIQMMEQGLEEEVRSLIPLRHYNALQTVGYKELFEFFDGKISREEAVSLIQRNSRRYAKRQETWFRRDPEPVWMEGNAFCAEKIEKYLREFV